MPPPMTTAASKQQSKAGEASWVQKEYEERLRRAMQKEGLMKPLLGHRTAPLGAVRRSANALVTGASEGTGQLRHTQMTTTTSVRSRPVPTAGRLRLVT